ncbi:MAG: ABC transporter permease subunit [SAR202 cluster bacterium]|nr:ABC transporter permease subunit [SAR202 cluster bacterium]
MKLLESRGLLTLALAGAFLWSLTGVDWGSPLIHTGGGAAARTFFLALFPPDLSPDFLGVALAATWPTLAYAVAGMTVAVLIGIPLGILASGTVVSSPALRLPAALVSRFSLGGLRAIHELVWAVLFVAAFGLSPLAAVLALGLPYGGILGRIYAELLHDVPPEPLRALRTAGASPMRQFLYGRVPLALPDMISYTFYRFECAIRSAAIMSFVGIQGLGYQIQLSLHDLLFRQVWTLLLFMLLLVVLVDQWSSLVRRKLAA